MTEARKPQAPPSRKDLRSFAITFGVVAALFATFLWWRQRTALAQWFGSASLAFFVAGALAPGLMRPFHGPWMKFAEILGYINTRLLLGVFYFIGMTPTGLLMRLAGKDPMTRSFKRKGDPTYWNKPAPHVDGARHFDRQF